MAKTKSMTRNRNNHSVSTKKRLKTLDKCYSAPWSDLNHHVLFIVMMKLEIVDILPFSGVCKSWRSLALSNKKEFKASKPPMSLIVSYRPYKKDCYLEDFQERKFKTRLPHSAGRTCVGITCGYLILFGKKICNYWLVNPITRHELHFPYHPNAHATAEMAARGVLVFSPSISGWVFVTTQRYSNEIWFSTAGQGSWSHVKSTFPILDLHFFKGKIYTLNTCCDSREVRHVCELSFNPEPKLTILETKNSSNPSLRQEFVSSGENLFVVQSISEQECKLHELNVDEMKWVSHEKTNSEYVVFLSSSKSSAAVKPSSWADPLSRRFADTPPSGNIRLLRKGCWPDMWYFKGCWAAGLWYFPHDCFNVNSLEV